jgi:hypothetical protein
VRGRFAGAEALVGRSCGPGAPRLGWRQAVFSHGDGDQPRAPHDEPGVGPHGEGPMARPAGPTAPFLVIQAHRSRGGRNATLAGPAAASHPHDRLERGGWWGKDPRRLPRRGGADTAPAQEPAAPPGRWGLGQRQPGPVLPARPLRPVASTAPAPPRHRPAGQERVDVSRRPTAPDLCLARDRQPIGLRSGLQPPPQAPGIALHAVPRAPGGGDAGGASPGQQRAGQWRRGRTTPVRRDPGLATTRPVLGPCHGQRQVPVQEARAQWPGRAPEHAALAVLDGAGRATVLAGDASRGLPCVQNAGLIQDQHAVRVPQMRDDIAAPRITHRIGVPVSPVQHRLEALGGGLAPDCGPRPAVLPLGRTEPALSRRRGPLAGLRAGEVRGPSPCDSCHGCRTALDAPGGGLGRRRQRAWRRVVEWSHGSVRHPCIRNHDTSVGCLLPL